MTDHHLTDEQNERLARDMGWQRSLILIRVRDDWSERDEWEWHREGCLTGFFSCPRYDEPGPLHEEMRIKYKVDTVRHFYFDTWSAIAHGRRNNNIDKLWASHGNPTIAECFAVLELLDYKEKLK